MFGSTIPTVWLPLFLLIVLLSPLAAAADYTFSQNEQTVHAKIFPVTGQRMGSPAPGDVAYLFPPYDFPIVLGKPGHYQLRSRDPAVLMARIGDGPERPLAARIQPLSAAESGILNPVAAMSFEERRHLRGLFLESQPVPRGWVASFAGIDWKQCALTVRPGPVPSFPQALRYLRMDLTQPQEDAAAPPFEILSDLRDLRYLFVQSPHVAFPLDVLTNAQSLVNLEIGHGTPIENVSALKELKALRFLKVRGVKGLQNLDWAPALRELRVLKVDDTEVSDLLPATRLPELRLLSINATRVATLPAPEAFPVLRDFRLHSTPAATDSEALAPYRPLMSLSVHNWDDALGAFAYHDYKFGNSGAVVFVGGSDLRLWDLTRSFPDHEVRNRGFGGSELSDALIHYDRLILPHAPQVIVLCGGGDDIAAGETAEQVVADWRRFAQRTRVKLPQTHLAFLAIKPSQARWPLWPEMQRANDAIAESTQDDPHLHYLDTATPLLREDGKPSAAFFSEDGLHLNAAGYDAWTAVVKPWLGSVAN